MLGPITLDIGTITLNGKLHVGSTQQEVVVSADVAALLRTESGEQSTTFDEKTMQQLPQVGQDWANFTILLPGSAERIFDGNSVTNPGAAVSLNGGQPYSGNFLSDGGSVTNPHSSDVETDTFETVAEVEIDDSNFSAQYGIGGAVFSQITKGGTNQFHGSLYEHFQNDALDARSYFQDPTQPVAAAQVQPVRRLYRRPDSAQAGCSSTSTTIRRPITRTTPALRRCRPISSRASTRPTASSI